MREAFIYMFKDTCFIKKASIYAILSFLSFTFLALADINSCSGGGCPVAQTPCVLAAIKPELVIYKLLGIIFNVLIAGFYIVNISAILTQKNNIVLPYFNFKSNILKGLKLYASVFVTSLVYYILISGYVILSFIIPNFTTQNINLLTALPFLIAIPILFYVICYNSFMHEYVTTNKFFTFFNFKKAIANIKEAPKNYFKNWGLLFGVFLITAILIFLIELALNFINNIYVVMVISNIISAVISTYVAYVSAYLISKSVINNN